MRLRVVAPAEAPAASRDTAERDATEAELVRRLAAGDRERSLRELYRRYAAAVHRIGLGMLGDRGRAEDLVQEVFVRLWRSAGSFDPGRGSVRAFVFTLARRAAIDQHRHDGSRPRLVREPAPAVERAMSAEDGPFEELFAGVEVREALEALSPDHRQVLELGYDEDLTQPQIAERLGIPLGTVKTRTFHALRGLRAECERRGLL